MARFVKFINFYETYSRISIDPEAVKSVAEIENEKRGKTGKESIVVYIHLSTNYGFYVTESYDEVMEKLKGIELLRGKGEDHETNNK